MADDRKPGGQTRPVHQPQGKDRDPMDESAPRALLFNGECHYLAEVFDDDGMVVDQLVRCSTVCPKPADLMFDDVRPAPAAVDPDAVRSFALG